MKLQRSIRLGDYAQSQIIEMGNPLDEDIYITLVECNGGITGTFEGWSRLGKSKVHPIYKVTPDDDIFNEIDDDNEKGGCYEGSILLPTWLDIEKKGAEISHMIPLLSQRDNRSPEKLILYIAPHDFVSISADQREVYKLIDDNGNEIPLENLLGGKQPASP